MKEHFKPFSVQILDYYNIRVYLLVYNKLSESIMYGTTIKIKTKQTLYRHMKIVIIYNLHQIIIVVTLRAVTNIV
jgi:hypothetical protein